MYVPYDLSKVKVLDLSQNFSMDSPPFAFYEGPTIKWGKKIAFLPGAHTAWAVVYLLRYSALA
jgi:hypothetical protein